MRRLPQKQHCNLKSAEATAFWPQHSPYLEAPYIYQAEAPGTAYGRKSYSAQLERTKVEDIERTMRLTKHCEAAGKERDRLNEKWKVTKKELELGRKQDKIDTWKRMQLDKDKRETRWTQKTEGHSFGIDQWAEDLQIYDDSQISNAEGRVRQRLDDKSVMNDQQKRVMDKLGEVDVLGNLRKEKKKLQEDQKDLKARLDLDKVDRRCAAAKMKQDMQKERHQEKLANMGHLDRSHSDFFTEPRLNPLELEARAVARGRIPMRRIPSSRSEPRSGKGYSGRLTQSASSLATVKTGLAVSLQEPLAEEAAAFDSLSYGGESPDRQLTCESRGEPAEPEGEFESRPPSAKSGNRQPW